MQCIGTICMGSPELWECERKMMEGELGFGLLTYLVLKLLPPRRFSSWTGSGRDSDMEGNFCETRFQGLDRHTLFSFSSPALSSPLLSLLHTLTLRGLHTLTAYQEESPAKMQVNNRTWANSSFPNFFAQFLHQQGIFSKKDCDSVQPIQVCFNTSNFNLSTSG